MNKVSIIMPVYNVQDTLGLAIASVLDQTYKDFELILVDDGSTDGSNLQCQFIALHDSRIRLIRQDNQGLAAARNTGIAAACYDIIAFLDSDDLWTEDKLQQHVDLLTEHPEVGVSYSASEFIDDAGRPLGVCQTPKTQGVTPADVLMRNPVGNGSSAVIRKQVFDQIRFRDEHGNSNYFDSSLRQSEDIECWVRIATTTQWEFRGIEQPLTLYRVNDSGLSANIDKQLASWEVAFQKMCQYAPELTKRYGATARAFQYRYLSRRAIRSNDARTALKWCFKAFATAPGIILREPARGLATALAALAINVLPQQWYQRIEAQAIVWNSRMNAHAAYNAMRSDIA